MAVSSATSSGPTTKKISCSDASSAYAVDRRSASANSRGHSERSDAPTGGISAPAAAAQIAIAGSGASSRASAQTPSRTEGKISARGKDPRLATPVDQPACDGRSDRGRHEVRARDRACRRVAAAVVTDEQQQGQPDHSHRQPRK